MKIPFFRSGEIITGREIFGIASLFLYATLLIHVVWAALLQHLRLGNAGAGAVALLVALFVFALVRCAQINASQHYPLHDVRWLLYEFALAILVIALLTLQRTMPVLPLPWLIGAAGVFPLALRARIAWPAIAFVMFAVFELNVLIGAPSGEWVPQFFVTLFVGALAIILNKALQLNLSVAQQAHESHMAHNAMHDLLTGLPNRRYLLKTIAGAMAAPPENFPMLAALFCDLDLFKSVNDAHGHEFGDKCLVEVTRRMLALLPSDNFIARFGGNEFVILVHDNIQQARQAADAILEGISQELIVDGVTVKIQASIGIAMLTREHHSPSELIRDADAAVYQAKERGRNRTEIFDAALHDHATRRSQMDVALRFALERKELAVVYQPKVSIADGSIQGFELLLRWNSAQYGHISPTDFIPIAESSGLVVPIGLWVLEEACKQLAAWQAKYDGLAGVTIGVNVSMRQLRQPSFLSEVERILAATRVTPGSIELELTETSAMANPEQTAETLSGLKALGFRIALDDFGTGYSSLAYLQKLPIDVIKIDRAFVHGLGTNPGDVEIIRMILALAKTLQLDTVAEGVETDAHVEQLKLLGCRLGQGFVFSPPLSVEDADQLLQNERQLSIA